jgi:hypothetical protein
MPASTSVSTNIRRLKEADKKQPREKRRSHKQVVAIAIAERKAALRGKK